MGDLYAATPIYGEVRKISIASGLISTAYRGAIGQNQYSSPSVVAMGPDNTLYFGAPSKIYKSANGSISVVAGGGEITGTLRTGMLATDLDLYVRSFVVAPNGETYFTESFRKGLNKIGLDGRITNYPIHTHPHTKLAIEPSGSILLGSHEGLYRFTPSTNELTLLYYVNVSALAVDAAGVSTIQLRIASTESITNLAGPLLVVAASSGNRRTGRPRKRRSLSVFPDWR